MKYSSCLFLGVGLVLARAVDSKVPENRRLEQVSAPKASPAESVQKFFYIVNESGRKVKVKVLADNRTLFVQEIGAKTVTPVGPEQAPPAGGPPARELKVAIRKSTQSVLIEELNSGLKKRFKISDLMKVDAGFRILIQKNRIIVAQDYLPIR